jgi:hypothetical protein
VLHRAVSITDDPAKIYALDGWVAQAYPSAKGGVSAMGNEVLSTEVLRHGAYICLTVPRDARARVATAAVAALADRLKLRNEFDTESGHPPDAIAFLRRLDAAPGAIAADDILKADAVVHVASGAAGPVAEFCAEATRLLAPAVKPHVLRGVVRPKDYTSPAMNQFAYAHQRVQERGASMPNAFLLPLSKTPAWWAKDWMERHTYFLPRYDAGRMVSQGHALAAAAGVPCLMRRTYDHETQPAPTGAYDFVTYFECADADVPTFHEVCAALRDVKRNPEWEFVREGPTWHGRRVATWAELFT